MNKAISYGLAFEDALCNDVIGPGTSGLGCGIVSTDVRCPSSANNYVNGNMTNQINVGRLKRLNAIVDMVTYGTNGIT
ncbi:hypothetical protein OFL77_27345, partial [Escherichia coli]|uniref:hypothetical protein n=1 Tax=Escherichia coli TaxID=562 RepID=UPI0021DF7D56